MQIVVHLPFAERDFTVAKSMGAVVNFIRFIFTFPYVRLVAGAVVLMGLVAIVTALFPAADRQTVATVGAFVVAGLVVTVFWPGKIHTGR